MVYPTPHLEKLQALINNDKLPKSDKTRIEKAMKVYDRWVNYLAKIINSAYPEEKKINRMVKALNLYRLYIDVILIFDSEDDFLYRNKGQIKLDNSIIEEFLPRLINSSLIPEVGKFNVEIGPINSFSSIYFESSLNIKTNGGGLKIRTKFQDFAISKKLYLKSSNFADFQQSIEVETNLAYVVAECKTNLDKTMFQEACATSHDLKSSVPGSKYFLLCEWLDMTPVSTAPTDIDQVIILRKAKRMSANLRKNFSTYKGRQNNREKYLNYLKTHPFRAEMFALLISNIRSLLTNEEIAEKDVLELGYF